MMAPNDEVLNSWKEVAAYLGRGVRTVQRWEQELGMPVRRPRGKSRSAVIAFKPELDVWLHQAPTERLGTDAVDGRPKPTTRTHDNIERRHRLHASTEVLMGQTRLLLNRSSSLREELKALRSLREELKALRQKVDETARITRLNIERAKQHGLPSQEMEQKAPPSSYAQQAMAS